MTTADFGKYRGNGKATDFDRCMAHAAAYGTTNPNPIRWPLKKRKRKKAKRNMR